MVEAGVIRRVRQTLLATKLAHGALVAWKFPQENINPAFDFMAKEDPFSGHVVLRTTDKEISRRCTADVVICVCRSWRPIDSPHREPP